MVGYSNGGALAVQHILSTLDNPSLPRISGLVLISPEIGVAKISALTVWQVRIGRLLGLCPYDEDPKVYREVFEIIGSELKKMMAVYSRPLQIGDI